MVKANAIGIILRLSITANGNMTNVMEKAKSLFKMEVVKQEFGRMIYL